VRRLAAAVSCAIVAPSLLALGACSSPAGPARPAGSNAGLTNTALQAAMKSAMSKATSLHVASEQAVGSDIEDMDLKLGPDGTCAESGVATLDSIPVTFEILKDVKYVRLSVDVITGSGKFQGATVPIESYQGKWVASTSSLGAGLTSPFTPIAPSLCLTEMAELPYTFRPDGTSAIAGRDLAKYQSADGATVWIPLSGPALPARITLPPGSGEGTINLTWNQPLTITAPPADQILSTVP
jgi:hypothetical protein